MAAFAEKNFNAEQYQSFRPSYPPVLYDTIYKYHKGGGGSWELCVDLGCGTGISTRTTAARFKTIIGVDPSGPMIESARRATQDSGKHENVKYEVSSAEKLGFLEDASVDMITAATSCQYFAFPDAWREITRVLRLRGTVAFFSYTVPEMGQPLTALNTIIEHYSTSPDEIGPYVSQPGFGTVNQFLDPIPSPSEGFDPKAEKRIKYIGEHFPLRHVEEREPVIMKDTMPWDTYERFHRSSSAVHNHAKAHLDDAQNPEGDITTRFMKRLKGEAEKMGYHEDSINVETPMTLLLFRKSA